jgi:hypothetical protein
MLTRLIITIIILTVLFIIEISMECKNSKLLDDDYYEEEDKEN